MLAENDTSNNEKTLLNLTPVYLQNTDNILNTLLFMCLDQGHDFHDGSSRTKNDDNVNTWVDLDFEGKGYLNKISQTTLDSKFSNGTNEIIFQPNDIFGQYDFIKGLLNTTFVGGNGAYGLVAVDEYQNNKLGPNPEIIIEESIKSNINFNILLSNQNYYIQAEKDCQGDRGLTIKIQNYSNAEIIFLPFYQRVYNGDMHKLWTFNTKKYIYLIKINNMTISKNEGIYKIQNPVELSCEKITVIDLIIPQYTLDFELFMKNKDNNFFTKLAEKLGRKIPVQKDAKTLNFLNTLNEEEQKIAYSIFAESLFNGQHAVENEASFSEEFPEKFNFLVPRGTKYYFANCQFNYFNFFLKHLYNYQIPAIHTMYYATNKVEENKQPILSKVIDLNSGEVNQQYNSLRSSNQPIPDTDPNFISKQYGFITDTNIGSGAASSTADVLIDYLNNSSRDAQCPTNLSGGTIKDTNLQFLMDDGGISEEDVNKFISSINLPTYEKELKTLMVKLSTDTQKCNNIIDRLKEYLTSKGKNISNVICYEKQEPPTQQPTISLQQQQQQQPISSIGTTVESISSTEPSVETTVSSNAFNNIDNVNEVFDLKLELNEVSQNPNTNINSTSMKNPISHYIDNYSNDLQLYYDFIDQTQNNTYNENNNYFNNCWISSDFYDAQGGSNYPFKFTVASGSLDSSSLGGQSIPQYNPPEVDVYMPIFKVNLNSTSELMGVIVRMVVVKKILGNPINSKSQVVVICHFAYVDFNETGITPPTDVTQYAAKIGELLKYTVENTIYVKDSSECYDIETLQSMDLNSDENIDFRLKINGGLKRNWYKYFTFTQGPTVKNSIVIPTSFFTLQTLKSKASKDYVANGIVYAADKLYSDSTNLQQIFTGNNGHLLFIKLFLIRNKYTGDKSRSTDTLFLNKVKYLEGVQISNDENTLYNSQMFGLNTIWSTSAKSVFYMTPYMTKTEKLPITSSVYINELCKGLKSNSKSSFASGITQSSESSDEKFESIFMYKRDILALINPEILRNLTPFFGFKQSNTIIEYWSEGIYDLEKLYEALNEYNNYSFDSELNGLINDYKSNKMSDFTNLTNNGNVRNCVNDITQNISNNHTKFMDIYESIKNTKKSLYKRIKEFAGEFSQKAPKGKPVTPAQPDKLNEFKEMILFLSKSFPWWIDLIIDNVLLDFNKKICDDNMKVLNTLNELLVSENILCNNKFVIYKFIVTTYKYIQDNSIVKCLEINDPNLALKLPARQCTDEKSAMIKPIVVSKLPEGQHVNYLKGIDPQTISELPTEEQISINLKNDEKYLRVCDEFLKTLKNIALGTDVNVDLTTKFNDLIKSLAGDVDAPEVTAEPAILNNRNIIRDVTKRGTEELPHNIINNNENDFSGGALTILQQQSMYDKDIYSPKEIQLSSILKPTQIISNNSNIVSEVKPIAEGINQNAITSNNNLTQFYENSYKSNVTAYLKNFVTIINKINNNYQTLLINYNENSKDIIIKILLKNILQINSSYVPSINSNDIISEIQNINNTYTIHQLVSITNTYSGQFNLYMVIYGLINAETLTNEQLLNILNDTISDYVYGTLNLPIPKPILQQKIINEIIPIETDPDELSNSGQLPAVNVIQGGNFHKQLNYTGKSKHKKYNNKHMITKRKNKKHIKVSSKKKRLLKIKRNTRKI